MELSPCENGKHYTHFGVRRDKTPGFLKTRRFVVAERVGFEPTVGCPITSFQDWLLKPLGHLSGYRKTARRRLFCGGVRGI